MQLQIQQQFILNSNYQIVAYIEQLCNLDTLKEIYQLKQQSLVL